MKEQAVLMFRGIRLHPSSAMAPVREDFLRLGAMAEEALKNSVKALANRDAKLAAQVAGGDQKIDDLEALIESRVLRLIALHGPMLQDLREATFLLKAITDIERIGDLSSKVAKNALELSGGPPIRQASDLLRMGEISSAMLKEVLDAYVSGNEEKAHAACQRDEEIDSLYKAVQREILGYMSEHPKQVEQGHRLLTVASSLERIADHTTNLGERAVYVLTGNKPHY